MREFAGHTFLQPNELEKRKEWEPKPRDMQHVRSGKVSCGLSTPFAHMKAEYVIRKGHHGKGDVKNHADVAQNETREDEGMSPFLSGRCLDASRPVSSG